MIVICAILGSGHHFAKCWVNVHLPVICLRTHTGVKQESGRIEKRFFTCLLTMLLDLIFMSGGFEVNLLLHPSLIAVHPSTANTKLLGL